MIDYIFVYGTLKPGLRFHYLCQDVGLVSMQEAYIENYDLYHLNSKNYPAILEGAGTVYGYIFKFDDIDKALEILDDLEGINTEPAHYFRCNVNVKPQNIRAWAYVYNTDYDKNYDGLEPVVTGRWQPKES